MRYWSESERAVTARGWYVEIGSRPGFKRTFYPRVFTRGFYLTYTEPRDAAKPVLAVVVRGDNHWPHTWHPDVEHAKQHIEWHVHEFAPLRSMSRQGNVYNYTAEDAAILNARVPSCPLVGPCICWRNALYFASLNV